MFFIFYFRQASVYVPPTIKDKPKEEDNSRSSKPKSVGGGGFSITKDLVQSLKQESATTVAKQDDNDVNMDDTPSGSKNTTIQEQQEKPKPKYDWGSGAGHTIRSSAMDIAEEEARIKQKQAEEAAAIPEPEVNIVSMPYV